MNPDTTQDFIRILVKVGLITKLDASRIELTFIHLPRDIISSLTDKKALSHLKSFVSKQLVPYNVNPGCWNESAIFKLIKMVCTEHDGLAPWPDQKHTKKVSRNDPYWATKFVLYQLLATNPAILDYLGVDHEMLFAQICVFNYDSYVISQLEAVLSTKDPIATLKFLHIKNVQSLTYQLLTGIKHDILNIILSDLVEYYPSGLSCLDWGSKLSNLENMLHAYGLCYLPNTFLDQIILKNMKTQNQVMYEGFLSSGESEKARTLNQLRVRLLRTKSVTAKLVPFARDSFTPSDFSLISRLEKALNLVFTPKIGYEIESDKRGGYTTSGQQVDKAVYTLIDRAGFKKGGDGLFEYAPGPFSHYLTAYESYKVVRNYRLINLDEEYGQSIHLNLDLFNSQRIPLIITFLIATGYAFIPRFSLETYPDYYTFRYGTNQNYFGESYLEFKLFSLTTDQGFKDFLRCAWVLTYADRSVSQALNPFEMEIANLYKEFQNSWGKALIEFDLINLLSAHLEPADYSLAAFRSEGFTVDRPLAIDFFREIKAVFPTLYDYHSPDTTYKITTHPRASTKSNPSLVAVARSLDQKFLVPLEALINQRLSISSIIDNIG